MKKILNRIESSRSNDVLTGWEIAEEENKFHK